MSVPRISRPPILPAAAVSRALAAVPGNRSGQEVVEQMCATCHASGVNGAPKIGSAKD